MELTKLRLVSRPLGGRQCFCDWSPLLQAMDEPTADQFTAHFCRLVDFMEAIPATIEDALYRL